MMPIRYFLRAALLVVLSVSAALAAPAAKTPAEPDPAANPVLSSIMKLGAKMYYLGSRSGLDGWFIVKDGRVQIAYATGDGQSLMIGALFGKDGENITAAEVHMLFQNNKDISALLTNTANEQASLTKAGLVSPTAALPPATAAATGAAALPAIELSPGERLMKDFAGATGVMLGSNASAPVIQMVMDPNCPHCQATWRALRDSVMKNTVQVRLIPIGTPESDSERAATVLLHVADPLNAWDRYVNGDKAQLAGAADPGLTAAARANHDMIDRWHIHVTPYLAYRAKDGKIKVVQGEPEQVAVLLADLP